MAETEALFALSQMTTKKPRAAALLQFLMSKMGDKNAVVINQKLIAKMMGVSPRTTQYAIADLVSWKWIEVVHLHGPGAVAAYVVNSNVAWAQSRSELHTSTFSATVVADFDDQPKDAKREKLQPIPAMMQQMAAATAAVEAEFVQEIDPHQSGLFETQ
jgi:hypothetical protein